MFLFVNIFWLLYKEMLSPSNSRFPNLSLFPNSKTSIVRLCSTVREKVCEWDFRVQIYAQLYALMHTL